MPYYVDAGSGNLTIAPLNETVFPTGSNKDLLMQIKLLREKWKRFYPALPYHQIKKAATPIVNIGTPVGETNTTKFDPLYMEAIDPVATVVKEPHLSGDLAASDPEVFVNPVNTYFQVVKESQDKELKKWGFDKARELVLKTPLGILDELTVTVQVGDKVVWNGVPYKIFQLSLTDTLWKNTNVPLFAVLNCGNYRSGS